MFQLGGAMYLLGAHYSIVKTLMSNPEWMAEKTVGTTKAVTDFKSNPTIKGLKKYLTTTCITSEKSATESSKPTAKHNLVQMLESDEDETPEAKSSAADVESPAKKQKKKKHKHSKHE
jgi:hypothetical protein